MCYAFRIWGDCGRALARRARELTRPRQTSKVVARSEFFGGRSIFLWGQRAPRAAGVGGCAAGRARLHRGGPMARGEQRGALPARTARAAPALSPPVATPAPQPMVSTSAAPPATTLFAAVGWRSSEFAAAQSSAAAALLLGNRGSDTANSDLIVQAHLVHKGVDMHGVRA